MDQVRTGNCGQGVNLADLVANDPWYRPRWTNYIPATSGGGGPLTVEGEMPQKKFYRARAHCNPLSFNESFEYPAKPEFFDWTEDHYPDHPSL